MGINDLGDKMKPFPIASKVTQCLLTIRRMCNRDFAVDELLHPGDPGYGAYSYVCIAAEGHLKEMRILIDRAIKAEEEQRRRPRRKRA